MQIEPVNYFYEGAFCSKRPVHDPAKWADSAFKGVDIPTNTTTNPPKSMEFASRASVDWNGSTLWPAWEKWFREGIE